MRQSGKNCSFLILFGIVCTLAVPSNVFAIGMETESTDEFIEVETPLTSEELDFSPNGIKKNFIVVFKESPSKNDIDNIQSFGEVQNQFKIIPGVLTELNESQANVLKNNGRVLEIFEDIEVSAFMDESVSIINADNVQSQGTTGAGIKVCVIDSGIDDSHPAINSLFAEISYVSGNPNPTDDYGHGTHVAGTIASVDGTFGGVAPGVSLMSVKALDQTGNGFSSSVISGIDWCVFGPDGFPDTGDESDIITMSLGGSAASSTCDGDLMASVANGAVDAGLTVIAASGNNGFSDMISTPACGSKVIAVGAVDKSDNIASFSNQGSELDVVAPGVSITSTVPTGSCTHCNPSGWKPLSGTSMATPHVAATAALLLDANSTLSNLEIRSIIENTTVDLGSTGWDSVYGHGRINAYDAYLTALEGISNLSPTANIDAYNAQKDTVLNVAAPGVLNNDTDPEDDSLTAVLDVDVTDGTLVLNSDGSFSYTPDTSFTGDDTFTYHAFDGTNDSNTVIVTITVTGAANQIFFDDFESGFTKWTETGEGDWELESPSEAQVPGNPSNLVAHSDNCDSTCTLTLATPIDLSTQTGASLSFWRYVDNDMDNGDYLKVELYDGASWSTLFTWTNGSGDDDTWHQEIVNLSGYLGASDFNLRFVTHESFWTEDAEIDDVLIEGQGGTPAPNDPPTANIDAYNAQKDTVLNVAAPGVLNNDTDPEDDSLTAVLDVDVTDGTLVLNSDGSFSYTPDTSFTGDDTFTYHAFDGTNDSNTVIVTITVTDAPNDPPTANIDAYNAQKDTVLNVAAPGVLNNDTDPEDDSLTAVLDVDVTDGTLVLNSDGSFSYTPDTSFTGDDTFTYHAFDGTNDSNTVIVTITVTDAPNDPPTANIDAYNAQKDTVLNVAAPGVLNNDTDPEDDSLTAVLDVDVTDGTLVLNSDGSFSYTPDTSFTGDDTFTYHAFDGTNDSNTVIVTITVTGAANQIFFDDFESGFTKWTETGEGDWELESPSEAQVPGNPSNLVAHSDNCDSTCTLTLATPIDLSTQTGASLSFWRYVDNDMDNGDYLKVELYDGASWSTLFTWTNGSGDDDTWHQEIVNLSGYLGASDFNLRFVTHESFWTEDAEIDDVLIEGQGGTPAPNDPPTANIDAYNAQKDTVLNVAAPGVLNNDTDPEDDSLTAVLDVDVTDGTLVLNSDGSFSYTPDTSFTGDDTFTYHAFDGTNDSNTVIVTITVTDAPNDPPTANIDAYNAQKDTVLNVAAPGVLNNDTDPEDDSLTAVLDVDVTDGTLVLNSDGSFSYTPDTSFTGDDTFTYHAFDGTNDSNTVIVTITVTDAPNDPPTANIDAYNAQKDTVLNVAAPGVLNNDTDPEDDSLTAVLDVDVTDGTLVLNSDGSFSYTPDTSFTGDDTFTYHAFDGTNDSNTVIVTITVTGAANQIFFDDFESGFTKWTETGEGGWELESPSEAQVPGNPSNLVAHSDNCDSTCTLTLATPIDLSTQTGASLSFWRYVDNDMDNGDYLKVELYDGASWSTLFTWTNGSGDDDTWHQEIVNLSGYLGASDFNLRFVTHESFWTEDAEIDDVLIEATG